MKKHIGSKLAALILSVCMIVTLTPNVAFVAYADEADTTAVAQIGDVQYDSVQEALTAAAAATDSTQTVKLLSDATEEDISFDMNSRNVILDLDGHVLTADIAANINTEQSTEPGKINLLFTVKNGRIAGDIEVTNGKLSLSADTMVEGGITVNDVVVLEVRGTVIQADAEKPAITVNGTGADGVKIMNTANINAAGVAVDVNEGILKVLSNTGSGDNLKRAKVEGTIDIASGATVNISGGVLDSVSVAEGAIVNITKGEFVNDPSAALEGTGYKAVKNEDGTWSIEAIIYVAQIGDMQYESVQEALTAAAAATDSTQTVTLLSDVTEENISFDMNSRNVILDLDGHVLTADIAANINTEKSTEPGKINLLFTVKNGRIAGDIQITNGKLSLSADTMVEGGITVNDVVVLEVRGAVIQPDAEKSAITVNGTGADGVKIMNTANINAAGVAVDVNEGILKVLSNTGSGDNLKKAKVEGTIDIASGATVNISGGVIDSVSVADGAIVNITNGEFKNDPSEVLKETGYKAVKNEDGTWSIVEKSYDEQISELKKKIADLTKTIKDQLEKIDELNKELEAKRVNIAYVTVKGIAAKTYTGSEILQTPELSFCDEILVEGEDYEVSYSDNTGVGTASVVFEGCGDFKGTLTKTFSINPATTSITKIVRGTKMFTVSWKKQPVQTSGYQVRYSLKSSMASATTKTVSGTSKVSLKVTKLKAKKKYYVQVRTYKTVSGKKYYSSWSTRKNVTTK